LVGAVGSFAVHEAAALATGGSPLTAYLRQLAGLEPRCRHHHLGRAVILAALGWTAAHLGGPCSAGSPRGELLV
jgi:hypothetical protein